MARTRKDAPAPTRAALADAWLARRPAATVAAFVAIALIALLLRLPLIELAPRNAYLGDHVTFMAWSDWAYNFGPLSSYDRPPQPALVDTGDNHLRLWMTAPVNYPPASLYAFWFQGALHRAAGYKERTVRLPPQEAARYALADGVLTGPVYNTAKLRGVNALLPILGDLVLALGVVALVRQMLKRRAPLLELLALAITLLAPPIMLDSAFWSQVDSWITALFVWTLVLLIDRRDLAAGVLLGVAAMTKPQVILFGPVFVFVAAARFYGPDGGWRPLLNLWKTLASATAAALLLALPFMLSPPPAAAKIRAALNVTNRATADEIEARLTPPIAMELAPSLYLSPGAPPRAVARAAEDVLAEARWGALRWFKRSYIDPVSGYDFTTMKAFNVWAVDWLIHIRDPDALRTGSLLLGLPRGTWGNILLVLGIAASWLLAAKRLGWGPTSLAACAFMILLCAFLLPTKVHERYIYYCLPFGIALAVVLPRVWPAVLGLLVVGTFELTWYSWLTGGDALSRMYGLMFVLSLLSIASAAYLAVILLITPRARLSPHSPA